MSDENIEQDECVARFDRGTTLDSVTTDNGFLKLKATVGRVGVLNYRLADGTIRRELRAPEEVFHKDSLDSLAMVPLTLDHPPRATTGGLVAPSNAGDHVVGHTGENTFKVGDDRIGASVMVVHDRAIKAIEGGIRQLSPGYTTRLDHTPGVWNGQAYDAVQRQIRYNHVALVERGRAGPTVSLHLDSDAEFVGDDNTTTTEEETPMADLVKINLDGVDFDVTEQAKQAFEARLDAKETEVKDLSTQLAEASARADALEADVESVKEQLAQATAPEAVQSAVQARLDLERKAATVLDSELTDKADRDIKVEVVKAVNPSVEAKLGCDVYLDAAFDLAVEAHKNRPNLELAAARKESVKETKNDAVDARSAFVARQKNLWKEGAK